ncbi:MAG TPA: 50S ribosomal protein L33 [Polyangiaceae bacterium]|nr:50S ribosomal protein L33 [Polyangiaceae bacterium]
MASGRLSTPRVGPTHSGRIRISLSCSVCGKRNYRSTKSPRDGEALSLKKFCNQCGQHTAHIEGK